MTVEEHPVIETVTHPLTEESRLIAELAQVREQRRTLNRRQKEIVTRLRVLQVSDRIAMFERNYPEAAADRRRELVLVGESCEEWLERLEAAGRTLASEDEVLARRHDRGGTFTVGAYVRNLIAADDPRVRGTVLAERYREAQVEVARWDDQTTGERDLTQADPERRPTLED